MKKLAFVFAVGAAALLGGSAANAADNSVKAKATTDATQQSTDFSSRGRHYRHYGYRSYRPRYGNSYGYYARALTTVAVTDMVGRTMVAAMVMVVQTSHSASAAAAAGNKRPAEMRAFFS